MATAGGGSFPRPDPTRPIKLLHNSPEARQAGDAYWPEALKKLEQASTKPSDQRPRELSPGRAVRAGRATSATLASLPGSAAGKWVGARGLGAPEGLPGGLLGVWATWVKSDCCVVTGSGGHPRYLTEDGVESPLLVPFSPESRPSRRCNPTVYSVLRPRRSKYTIL